jgi:phospholipid/cholesterol/gamma-HCH transport system permease protein
MGIISNIGKYFIMLRYTFSRPEKLKIYKNRIFEEIEIIGLDSIPIVSLLSVFMGAIITLQTAANMDSPLLPVETIGFITRQSTILEFSPTIISLILAGKIGSNIASQIGTMRVTEQIDALDIMGINSQGFLILPKIIAAFLSFPILIIYSMMLSLVGGLLAGVQSGLCSETDYIKGLRYYFVASDVTYGLVKTLFFAFLITTISSFYGYYVKGGALDVGASSTKAVVYSSIAILLTNFVLTKLMLV